MHTYRRCLCWLQFKVLLALMGVRVFDLTGIPGHPFVDEGSMGTFLSQSLGREHGLWERTFCDRSCVRRFGFGIVYRFAM